MTQEAKHTIREVQEAYELSEGEYARLPNVVKATLYAACGINDSLIAAAPKLLEALESLISYHWSDAKDPLERKAYERARAAIAKATGKEAA